VILPCEKCAEIVEQTKGQVQIIYGLGGIAMMDGLAHGASAMMPGAACLEITCGSMNFINRAGKRKRRNSSSVLFHTWPLRYSNLRLLFRSKSVYYTSEEFCRISACARRLFR
jgi:hypothetical protein